MVKGTDDGSNTMMKIILLFPAILNTGMVMKVGFVHFIMKMEIVGSSGDILKTGSGPNTMIKMVNWNKKAGQRSNMEEKKPVITGMGNGNFSIKTEN